jgi:hypothetical protein
MDLSLEAEERMNLNLIVENISHDCEFEFNIKRDNKWYSLVYNITINQDGHRKITNTGVLAPYEMKVNPQSVKNMSVQQLRKKMQDPDFIVSVAVYRRMRDLQMPETNELLNK